MFLIFIYRKPKWDPYIERKLFCGQFLERKRSVETVLQKELFCGHSSPKRTVLWTQFFKKNCSEELVLEKELLCGHSSQKRTVYWVQFLEKIRFKELRAVVGLVITIAVYLLSIEHKHQEHYEIPTNDFSLVLFTYKA